MAQTSIRALIALLRDGEKGFRELAGQIRHAECRAFLLEESVLRGIYADRLERSVREATGKAGGLAWDEAGTRLGTMHRRWIAFKAAVGADDHALLETTETCEWFAAKAYEEALRDDALPDRVRKVIAEQARGVRQSRNMVQEFRRLTGK